MHLMFRWCLLTIFLILPRFALAQDTDTSPPITRETIHDLTSVLQIDFNDDANIQQMNSGWLRISPNGDYLVTANQTQTMYLIDTHTGTLSADYTLRTEEDIVQGFFDVAWRDDSGAFHVLHGDGASYTIAVFDLETRDLTTVPIPTGDDLPVRVWADDDPAFTWIEVMPADTIEIPYVLKLDIDSGEIIERLDSAPEADATSRVRIGRMPAPLAVTSTPEGDVRLWHLEDGDLLSETTVSAMPAFGHMNGASARRLAWRDPMSQTLNILDFDTTENTPITDLDGAYVQAFLLTDSADVILGVNVNLDPVIVAWDVETGEQTTIGNYRDCGRTPDMIQLSDDSTTLAIGCDTGFDIWRIEQTQGE